MLNRNQTNWTGRTFGRLTYTGFERHPNQSRSIKGHRFYTLWVATCTCGKVVKVPPNVVQKKRSCGCGPRGWEKGCKMPARKPQKQVLSSRSCRSCTKPLKPNRWWNCEVCKPDLGDDYMSHVSGNSINLADATFVPGFSMNHRSK